MNRKRIINGIFLLILIIGTAFIIRQHNDTPYQYDKGMIFGTVYNIKYQYDKDLKDDIEKELMKVDNALSMFNSQSIISKINTNRDTIPDSTFMEVYSKGMKIARNTGGLYDITVAPLCNAWGFGFKKSENVSKETIDSILQFIGYDKFSVADGKIIKKDERCMLDCSSIAKGFGCDMVARLFKKKGITNYMVEIGGEVMANGLNNRGEVWRIGINKPIEDSLCINNEIQTIIKVENSGVATSGNYRNFYIKDGKKFSHTINPITGYPVNHSLLSATVVADDCMTADAYATAFMVMGTEKAKLYADTCSEIKAAYFISDNGNGGYKIDYTRDMELYFEKQDKQ